MNKVGIVGGGVVGNATAQALWLHTPLVYDTDHGRCGALLHHVLDCQFVFVCLPTPQKADSYECDTSILDAFLESIRGSVRTVVIRSTVPIGYTQKAREKYNLMFLQHWPEFLTVRTAIQDACNPVRNIVGGPDPAGKRGLLELIGTRWPDVPLYSLSSDESEFVKLMQNAFSAVKISFFNEMHQLADAHDMEWERCMSALLAGGWINPMHTAVPGPDGQLGYGGACLPKDIANLYDCATDADTEANILSGAMLTNKWVRTDV